MNLRIDKKRQKGRKEGRGTINKRIKREKERKRIYITLKIIYKKNYNQTTYKFYSLLPQTHHHPLHHTPTTHPTHTHPTTHTPTTPPTHPFSKLTPYTNCHVGVRGSCPVGYNTIKSIRLPWGTPVNTRKEPFYHNLLCRL